MTKDYTFISEDGSEIEVTAYFKEKYSNRHCIICVHGFKGFKDWGFWPYTGQYFAEAGYNVITFNFSHNGIGRDKFEFTETEKFAANTFSREVSELNQIISACRNNYFDFTCGEKIGLIGHSRGGAVSLLAGVSAGIDAFALWASIAKLDRYSERQKEEWRRKGHFEVDNSRTKQVMKLNLDLLTDIEENAKGALNIENAVINLGKTLLIAHGDQDLAVPVKEAEQIYAWSDKSRTELFKIYQTGHTFDIQHPFTESNRKFDSLLKKTLSFFNANLN